MPLFTARRLFVNLAALMVHEFSRPVTALLRDDLLTRDISYLHLHCGRGEDLSGLSVLGYKAAGWDGIFQPETRHAADIVNLGYYLGELSEQADRAEALASAYKLTRKILVVAGVLHEASVSQQMIYFRDPASTQKIHVKHWFEHHELQQLIEDVLHATAVPAGPGLFYVFRNPEDEQDFLWACMRTPVDMSKVMVEGSNRKPEDQELLEWFWARMLELGRRPAAEEFPGMQELRSRFGSARKAEQLFKDRFGAKVLRQAQQRRMEDLLIYIAVANSRRRVRFNRLSASLRRDVKAFFPNYTTALTQALQVRAELRPKTKFQNACETLKIGWQDKHVVYLHRALVDSLPLCLRFHVKQAIHLCGRVPEADVLKLHKSSGAVTFLCYDNFEEQVEPKLLRSVKVNAQTSTVQIFNYPAERRGLRQKGRFTATPSSNLLCL